MDIELKKRVKGFNDFKNTGLLTSENQEVLNFNYHLNYSGSHRFNEFCEYEPLPDVVTTAGGRGYKKKGNL